jgi:hypothetical protein
MKVLIKGNVIASGCISAMSGDSLRIYEGQPEMEFDLVVDGDIDIRSLSINNKDVYVFAYGVTSNS